ncbi:MAG: hypothetical protein H7Y11_05300, partial [Armatimonadetes bacterium]|nr:hypothetical protein [Anaerolineae bacterium]
MTTKFRQAMLGTILILAIVIPILAAPGDLDGTFGTGGAVRFIVDGDIGYPYDMALSPSGQIVLAGYAVEPLNRRRIVVARLTSGGGIDGTFGGDGVVTTIIETGAAPSSTAYAVLVDAQGRVIIGGSSSNETTEQNLTLVRYQPDGTLDSSFGQNGIVLSALDVVGPNTVYGLALDANGRLLVTGNAGAALLVARYLPNGTLDTTFNSSGVLLVNYGDFASGVQVLVDANDHIIVAGNISYTPTTSDILLLRLKPDGSPDPSFGEQGMVITNFGDSDLGRSLAIDGDGRLIVGGVTANGAIGGIALARYLPNGNLDNSFGVGGISILLGKPLNDLALLPNGSLMVVSYWLIELPDGYTSDVLLTRFNPDGSLDTSFGQNGSLTTDLSEGAVDYASAAVLDADGRLLVAGAANISSAYFSTGEYFAARYLLDGEPRVELLINGGFEQSGNPVPNWEGIGLAKDKQLCNKPETGKYVAYSGVCAFRFKGALGETAKLRQTVDTTLLTADTQLTLSVWAYSPSVSPGKGALKVLYANGTKSKIKLALTATANGYRQF